jgi:hypothetical protein
MTNFKIRFEILLVLLLCNLCVSQNNPFTNLEYDKVVMYDYEGRKGVYLVDKNGELSKTIKKQVILDEKTEKELIKKLGQKSSYGEGTAACFDPHLGFIFYCQNKIVANIAVCFSCNRLQSSLDIPAQKQGKIGSGDDIGYLLIGMSESFKKFLNELVLKYKFSHSLQTAAGNRR